MVPSRLTNGTGHREGSTSCGKAGISSSETMFQGSSIHHQAALPLGRRLRRRLGRAVGAEQPVRCDPFLSTRSNGQLDSPCVAR